MNRNRQDIKDLFRTGHLPYHLREIAEPFMELALDIFDRGGPFDYAEQAIMKLWEAKNLAVWLASEPEDF